MVTKQNTPTVREAFFRFYEELNDFLTEEERKKSFPYEFTGKLSIKDAIEAIGVPPTEIDLILVNGESVGFNYKMCGGEHISVYPVFESFDITPLVQLRCKALRKTKFVVDADLGKLAHKLRLLGFDTLVRKDFSDSEVIELSLREKRIILTRDQEILKHRAVTHAYLIRNNQPKEQLREVIKRLQLESNLSPVMVCLFAQRY